MSDKGSIQGRIEELKARRGALILAHNYQLPEVQDIADFVGDSLGLSRKAAAAEAEVIVFCGVDFMAETAAILCPDKTVLMPDPNCNCPMANMVTPAGLLALKAEHPGAVVVSYVNTTVEVKAESDLCCTSANAAEIIESIDPDRPIIFVPDKYLGAYAGRQAGRELILWEGYCPTHVAITPEHVAAARRQHPGAVVTAHPECLPGVTEMAEAVRSTSGMVRFARETDAGEVIVATEIGLLYRLRKENPDKTFIPASPAASCKNMKRNTAEKILWCLEDMRYEMRVDPEVRERARGAIDAMVAAREAGKGAPSRAGTPEDHR